MKKLCLLFVALTLTSALCSCGVLKTVLNFKVPFDPTPIAETTAFEETAGFYETTEIPDTTVEPEPMPVVVPIPAVVCANSYEKEAIDAFFPEEKFGFTHKVEYPKIDSDKSGATALNEAFAQRYEEIINTLKDNREDNVLYHITYTTSECNSVIFINITEYCGWQYSEGYTSQKIYYYDVLNDKELALDEYLTVFGIDRGRLNAAIRSSYEISRIFDETPQPACLENGAPVAEPKADTLYCAEFESYEDYAEFVGIEFIGGEKPVIRAYLTGGVYIASPFTCDVYADSYTPVNPYYWGYSTPAGANESNDIIVNFEGGKVVSLSAPSKYDIQSISYSSSEIKLVTKVNVRDSRISINGCEPYSWGNGALGGTDEEMLFIDTYYVNEYIPMNELNSIIITVIEE